MAIPGLSGHRNAYTTPLAALKPILCLVSPHFPRILLPLWLVTWSYSLARSLLFLTHAHAQYTYTHTHADRQTSTQCHDILQKEPHAWSFAKPQEIPTHDSHFHKSIVIDEPCTLWETQHTIAPQCTLATINARSGMHRGIPGVQLTTAQARPGKEGTVRRDGKWTA